MAMRRGKGSCLWGFAVVAVLISITPHAVSAAEALVAVAANFLVPARALAASFAAEGGGSVDFSSGSTGALYAQITLGAPFDVFLAAGDREPVKLVESGQALAETRLTYAVGSLVLWSADPKRVPDDCSAVLKDVATRRIAIANPDLAPYGAAARAVLKAWKLWEDVAPRLLRAENVGQVFQFVSTGNAELGFVARSQVWRLATDRAGSHCVIDPALYPPIRQQGVLLHHGEHNDIARRFLRFLQGARGREIIRNFGYGVEAVP